MSIRLRFTLLYNAILALTLAVFGLALYAIQASTTYAALKQDLIHSSDRLSSSVLRSTTSPGSDVYLPPDPPPADQFDNPDRQVFRELPEREILRVLDSNGALLLSPFGRTEDVLPLSAEGLQAAQSGKSWWETGLFQDQNMLIYTRPLLVNGKVVYILQSARPLTERNRSLEFLAITFITASLITILIAFGIGWAFSGMILQPIHRMTQTAQTIGEERDFTRRVAYNGPQDEVGQLASTFNTMLAQLQDAYQKLAHSLEMQRNFVADVSHELRTPLTTLRGNLGLLDRQPPIPAEERSDILNDMTDESDRLIRLVNDLLVLARADAGRSLAKDPVEILPVLEEASRQARQLEAQREISIDAEELSIPGDRDALKQVLLILLDNALKHSHGSIQVSAHRNGSKAEIRVTDSGAGIPPEKLAHVFDRFFRGEASSTLPGFGLGLPIARALVEGMDGAIEMQSEVGVGSVVILSFPAIS
jgi:signal transduction histidine kinase